MDVLSDEFYKARSEELAQRVRPKRFKHSMGVSDTAVRLAKRYGFSDEFQRKARLAGILHDWDKGYDDEGIRARVGELGLEGEIDPWIVENMPRVLHGPTASRALERQYPDIPKDIIDAIYKHTTASIEMSDLAKIIYIADAIEPSREFDAIGYLRDSIDEVSLDELYLRIYKFWTLALIEHDCVLCPGTLDIWNDLALQVQKGRIESDRMGDNKKKTSNKKKHRRD